VDRFRVLGSSFAMILTLAPYIAQFILASYVATFMFYEDGLAPFSSRDFLWVVLVQMCVQSLTDPFAAFMFKSLNSRFLIAFGTLATASVTFSLLFAKTTFSFAVTMVSVAPLGYSLLNFTALMSLWEWVGPTRRGLVTGLISMARIVSISVMIVIEMTVLNNKGIIIDKKSLYPEAMVHRLNMFIYVAGSTQVFLGLVTMFTFKRNQVQVDREGRYREELAKMNPAKRQELRDLLTKSNSEDMAIEFLTNPYTHDYLSHIQLYDVLYTKQFYLLFFTDMCVSFFAFLTLIISVSQLNSPTLFKDGQTRYMIFSAIIGGSVAAQPLIGWLFDSVKSIRVMSLANILTLICTGVCTSVFGVRSY